VYGKLGDQIGRKPLFVTAILLFLTGSVLGALAWGIDVLIAARAVQGLGGGGLMVLSQAIIADVVPARRRGRYMGVMGAVFGVSSVLGPLLGGFFTEGPGWRWALWFNVPVCLLALTVAVACLHLPRRGSGAAPDKLGTALMMVGTSALILLATWGGHEYAWTSSVILGLGAVFLPCAVTFVVVERSVEQPLLPLRVFAARTLSLTSGAVLVMRVAKSGIRADGPAYSMKDPSLRATAARLKLAVAVAAMMGTAIIS